MILIDANVLLYAKIEDGPHHAAAKKWLDSAMAAPHKVGIAWPTVQAFIRVSTNPRLFEFPLSANDAIEQVERWLNVPNVWTPTPTERHLEVLSQLVRQTTATGNLVSDAELAALAIQHGLELCSTDGDFARFPMLRWRNPLA